MDETRRLSDDELNEIDGGKIYVSVAGGEPIEAKVGCVGGNVNIIYNNGGANKYIDLGLAPNEFGGNEVYHILKFVESQSIINLTFKAN